MTSTARHGKTQRPEHDQAVVSALALSPRPEHQDAQPEVWVIGEAGGEKADERFEWIRSGLPADSRRALAGDMGADSLAVPSDMTGDGRDRPSPSCESVDLHVFSLCEH